jgi:ABC-2 type transport system ATP-binding protein
VDEVLALVGLTDVASSKPKKFSMGMGQRLGLAAALLGEPHTLILDEPANGLDPQGILWMRLFLKSLAAEGRSIFVSSHLLSEMALMADHLVVIGKGRLIATGPVEEFVSSAQPNAVVVRTPEVGRLGALLTAQGASVDRSQAELLTVTGLTADAIGDLAFDHGVRLHELSNKVATLEEAFLERTAGAEEFQAYQPSATGEGVAP